MVDVRQGVFARVFLDCWLSCAADDTLHTLRFGLNAVYVDPWALKKAKRGKTLTWECSKLGHKSSCAILEVVFPVVCYFKVVNLWL